jgi:peptidoglycan DL-endopeptidase CwlO
MLAWDSRRRARRAGIATVIAAALLSGGIAATPAGASPEDDLAKKRAQAEALEADLAENGTRISILDEEFNQTQIAIETANTALADNQERLDAAARRSEALRTEVASRAAFLYVGASSGGPLPMLDASNLQEVGTRSKYGAAAAEEDSDLLDELTVAKEDLGDARAALEQSKAEAGARQQELEATRAELDDAQAAQQELLDGVEGDIGELVAEIEAQRQAEEEARARAEFERQVAEQTARAAAERTQRDADARQADAAREAEEERQREQEEAANVANQPEEDSSSSDGGSHGSAPAPNSRAQVAVDTAYDQLGKPYRYAGRGPDSFDCSGLTSYVWAAAGVSIAHSSGAQYASLPHVSQSELAPGDLVFYGSPIHHVGIYVGGGQYIHAPQTGDVVKISSIYRSDYAGAARPG